MTIPNKYSANLLREYNFLTGSLSDQANANICTVNGGANFARGTQGTVMNTDGTTGYLSHAAVNLTGDFTMIAYIKARTIDGSDNAILTTDITNPARLEFNNGNQIRILLQDLTPISVTYSITAADYLNKWLVLAATRSGNTTTIYVDGVAVASDTLTGTLNSNMEYVGALSGTSRFFNGNTAYAAYYSAAITAADMQTYYAELRNMNYPSKPSAKIKVSSPNLLEDGDMEASGTSDWADINTATLSKVTSGQHGGSQALRVTKSGAVGGASQNIISNDLFYTISGWARGDGTARAAVGHSTDYDYYWAGTTSTTWEYFEVTVKAAAGKPLVNFSKYTSGGDWVEFDDVKVVQNGATYQESWKTDWAANVSNAAVSAGFLENTPFEVFSGSWKVSTDTINSSPVKVFECVTAGAITIPTSIMGQTPTEAAYGEWEFWFKKAVSGTTNTYVMIISEIKDVYSAAGQNGYLVFFGNSEQVYVYEVTNGTPVLKTGEASAIVVDTWNKLRITRTTAGVTAIYLNGALLGGGGATNPFTDNTFTTSTYFSVQSETGDMVAISDISGNHSFTKKLT